MDGRELTSADSLLADLDGDPSGRALVNWDSEKWGLYIRGYQQGADVLIEQALGDTSSLDLLVYPAMFLYRHYLELTLKLCAWEASRVRGPGARVPKGHDVRHLWGQLCQRLAEAIPDWPPDQLSEMSRLIGEFATIDPGAQGFRYPVDSKGGPSLEGVNLINLRNVRNVMGKIAFLLDCMDAELSNRLDFILERESEMGDSAGL
ncbi:MAG: hypothetical protein RBS17_05030 [Coriobacteriia bacterium]|nr:hypothetical protein [Coriobacteriia bacterium]